MKGLGEEDEQDKIRKGQRKGKKRSTQRGRGTERKRRKLK
jgi:hypothetical protein